MLTARGSFGTFPSQTLPSATSGDDAPIGFDGQVDLGVFKRIKFIDSIGDDEANQFQDRNIASQNLRLLAITIVADVANGFRQFMRPLRSLVPNIGTVESLCSSVSQQMLILADALLLPTSEPRIDSSTAREIYDLTISVDITVRVLLGIATETFQETTTLRRKLPRLYPMAPWASLEKFLNGLGGRILVSRLQFYQRVLHDLTHIVHGRYAALSRFFFG